MGMEGNARNQESGDQAVNANMEKSRIEEDLKKQEKKRRVFREQIQAAREKEKLRVREEEEQEKVLEKEVHISEFCSS